MKAFSDDIEALVSVVALLTDPSGVLIEANAGGLHLLRESGIVADDSAPVGSHLSDFFLQPPFAELANLPPVGVGPVHQGLITLGSQMGMSRTLLGRVWRHPDGLRLLAEHDVSELERIQRSLVDVSMAAATTSVETGQSNLRLRQREVQIIAATLTDPLTGVGNRRRLDQALSQEIDRARRTGQPLSAFMADLDFFKRVNDQYGHAAGDAVLVHFAAVMREQLRSIDVITRQGGTGNCQFRRGRIAPERRRHRSPRHLHCKGTLLAANRGLPAQPVLDPGEPRPRAGLRR